MSKEDFIDSIEYFVSLVEIDLASPYLIIFASVIVLFLNIFIIHKLSFLSHMHSLEEGVVAVLYYVFEAINFILALLFIDVLLKTYNKANSKVKYFIAFAFSILNPLLFSIVFY